MQVVQLVVNCNFGQLTHSELCFLECAIRFTGIAKRKPFWDLMYEAVAKLIVLNVQVRACGAIRGAKLLLNRAL